jgi:uncharacterized protein (TIGR02186 family)
LIRLFAASAFFCLTAFATQAQTPTRPDFNGLGANARTFQESIEIGASTEEIPIGSDFKGADFTLFGALNNIDQLMLEIGHYDIVVTLEGPRSYNTVRKKERVAGMWINTEAVTFIPLPGSYAIASTREVNLIASEGTLSAMGLGFDHLPLRPAAMSGTSSHVDEFQDAFRRLKLASGSYQNHSTGVRLERTGLFWATLRLPANVPNGLHTARAYLFRDGNPIAQRELTLRVVKSGMEQAISNAARETPIAYGFLCVLLALVTGWSASILFRKD